MGGLHTLIAISVTHAGILDGEDRVGDGDVIGFVGIAARVLKNVTSAGLRENRTCLEVRHLAEPHMNNAAKAFVSDLYASLFPFSAGTDYYRRLQAVV